MTNVLKVVEGMFTTSVRRLYPEFNGLKNTVQHSGGKFGDYKCTVALPISQVGDLIDYVCMNIDCDTFFRCSNLRAVPKHLVTLLLEYFPILSCQNISLKRYAVRVLIGILTVQ